MKRIFISLFVISLCSCSMPSDNQSSEINQESQTTQQVVQKTAVSQVDGTYVFDTNKYKEEQLKLKESTLKEMSAEDVDKLLNVFKPFRIDVNNGAAIATFSNDVVRGTLKTLSQNNETTRLFMTPTDEDKKNDAVTFIINGDSLVLDPGKKEADKMYFKKAP